METQYFRQKLAFMIGALIIGILSLFVVGPYFTVVVLSLIAVIVVKPFFDWVLRRPRIKGKRNLAAAFTVALFLLVLVVPVVVIGWVAISQLAEALAQVADADVSGALETVMAGLEGSSADVSASDVAGGLQTAAAAVAAGLATIIVDIISSLPETFIQAFLFLILLGSLLPRYDQLMEGRNAISPLGPELSKLYGGKMSAMVKSLVLGVFLIAFIQGAAMGVFYWLAGLPYVFLLSLISMLLAIIPMVGISWLVIVISIVAFATGNPEAAIWVLVGFYGVVNWIDLLLRPKLLSEDAHLPMALFLLAIFGGLAWAGLMGLFYGPVIVLLLVTTVQIYSERYASEDGQALHGAYVRYTESAAARLSSGREGEAEAEPEPSQTGPDRDPDGEDSEDPGGGE